MADSYDHEEHNQATATRSNRIDMQDFYSPRDEESRGGGAGGKVVTIGGGHHRRTSSKLDRSESSLPGGTEMVPIAEVDSEDDSSFSISEGEAPDQQTAPRHANENGGFYSERTEQVPPPPLRSKSTATASAAAYSTPKSKEQRSGSTGGGTASGGGFHLSSSVFSPIQYATNQKLHGGAQVPLGNSSGIAVEQSTVSVAGAESQQAAPSTVTSNARPQLRSGSMLSNASSVEGGARGGTGGTISSYTQKLLSKELDLLRHRVASMKQEREILHSAAESKDLQMKKMYVLLEEKDAELTDSSRQLRKEKEEKATMARELEKVKKQLEGARQEVLVLSSSSSLDAKLKAAQVQHQYQLGHETSPPPKQMPGSEAEHNVSHHDARDRTGSAPQDASLFGSSATRRRTPHSSPNRSQYHHPLLGNLHDDGAQNSASATRRERLASLHHHPQQQQSGSTSFLSPSGDGVSHSRGRSTSTGNGGAGAGGGYPSRATQEYIVTLEREMVRKQHEDEEAKRKAETEEIAAAAAQNAVEKQQLQFAKEKEEDRKTQEAEHRRLVEELERQRKEAEERSPPKQQQEEMLQVTNVLQLLVDEIKTLKEKNAAAAATNEAAAASPAPPAGPPPGNAIHLSPPAAMPQQPTQVYGSGGSGQQPVMVTTSLSPLTEVNNTPVTGGRFVVVTPQGAAGGGGSVLGASPTPVFNIQDFQEVVELGTPQGSSMRDSSRSPPGPPPDAPPMNAIILQHPTAVPSDDNQVVSATTSGSSRTQQRQPAQTTTVLLQQPQRQHPMGQQWGHVMTEMRSVINGQPVTGAQPQQVYQLVEAPGPERSTRQATAVPVTMAASGQVVGEGAADYVSPPRGAITPTGRARGASMNSVTFDDDDEKAKKSNKHKSGTGSGRPEKERRSSKDRDGRPRSSSGANKSAAKNSSDEGGQEPQQKPKRVIRSSRLDSTPVVVTPNASPDKVVTDHQGLPSPGRRSPTSYSKVPSPTQQTQGGGSSPIRKPVVSTDGGSPNSFGSGQLKPVSSAGDTPLSPAPVPNIASTATSIAAATKFINNVKAAAAERASSPTRAVGQGESLGGSKRVLGRPMPLLQTKTTMPPPPAGHRHHDANLILPLPQNPMYDPTPTPTSRPTGPHPWLPAPRGNNAAAQSASTVQRPPAPSTMGRMPAAGQAPVGDPPNPTAGNIPPQNAVNAPPIVNPASLPPPQYSAAAQPQATRQDAARINDGSEQENEGMVVKVKGLKQRSWKQQ